MKKTIVAALFAFCGACGAIAQESVKLPEHSPALGKDVVTVFGERQSTREFSDAPLTDSELGDLLWMAMGVNRTESDKLTAPSALNRQEIRLFVFRGDGVYEYLPQSHELNRMVDGDHRDLVAGGQDFAKTAPVAIVLVADGNKFGNTDDRSLSMMAVDAGIVCQNINLAAAALGLATVPRATMEGNKISELLGLGESQIPLMNNPVGHRK